MNRIPAESVKEIDQITGKEFDIIEAFPLDSFPALLNGIAGELQDEEIAAVTGQLGEYALRLAKVACYNYPQPWKKRKVLPAGVTLDLRKRMLAGERIDRVGDSHSATYWYVLSEDGSVKEYQFSH